MERIIHDTAEHCRQREAFGKSLLHNQYVQYRLGELATEVELLRSLTYRTVGKYEFTDIDNILLYVGIFFFKLFSVIQIAHIL